MADALNSLLGIIPVAVAGGLVVGLTSMMLSDNNPMKITSSSKSMSLLDSVK